jgi:RNA polymerase sigma-70 factor (ECF subfamily)
MKTRTWLATLFAGALCQLVPINSSAQDVASMAPVVVKTVPEAGTKDVAPGEMEIKVTFSKEMMDQSWSWSTAWKDSTPESIGNPHYDADHKTCVLKVKLEPNKTYGYWINTQNFHGFKDAHGHSAVPYLLVFQTKGN